MVSNVLALYEWQIVQCMHTWKVAMAVCSYLSVTSTFVQRFLETNDARGFNSDMKSMKTKHFSLS